MARSPSQASTKSEKPHTSGNAWARTVSLVVIAAVLVLGASTQMTVLIVPCILALVLAIALRPLADRIERLGVGRGVSSILCTLLVALVFLSALGLVVVQASRVVRNSDRYYEQLSQLATRVSGPFEDSQVLDLMMGSGSDEDSESDEDIKPNEDSETEALAEAGLIGSSGSAMGTDANPEEGGEDEQDDSPPFGSQEYWTGKIQENAGSIGQWLLMSVGGVLGVLGQVIVFLFLILYILLTRATWSDRIVRAGHALGMSLEQEDLGRMGHTIVSWVKCVMMVSVGYAVIIALTGWAIGLPQWPLWGLMTGFLVLVPYFGALIAGTMLVTVAAISSQALWPPLVMLGVYILLQTLESYVILPMLYGEAISIDPLAVLIGVLFFGFLWGPLGFVAALPMMVLIRGFVEVTPGSAPIGALFGQDSKRK